ncbi:glycosyltransferase family 4 protein [Salimicrobium halophilum]|uniref:Glycosyltransferase involved in cell wall bisynthesis n=1 Tax=Salimicrobium halophilum TaxID=86666 RepID=A0A1G8SBC2_9BACI|nr:glycosyltransferase family 4 protein [Salimicrobium halophilum]SDJ26518.1 Glycosyltransferase involved in cell wall bisynthesis [Salimicrobium halophilum]
MNVLLLTDKLRFGGAEIYFCKLENHLEHPDIDFTFAASPGELEDRLKHQERFIRLQPGKHRQNIRVLEGVVRRRRIDVIHANSLRMVLYSLWMKRISRLPVRILYTKHNVTMLEKKRPALFSYLMNHHVDKIITVSRYEQNRLMDIGVKEELVKTIHNGVDLTQFDFVPKTQTETFRVGILARISPEKNHELFVNIAYHLKDVPGMKFYIAGDGPDADKIRRMIEGLGLWDKVEMLGMVDDPQVFIQSMDLLLLTSLREVFPMVIIEALATGTPVLSIDRGGIKEAITEGETGILIGDHSVESFSEAILSMYDSDQQQREKVSREGRKKAEKEFSLDKMVHETIDEYLAYQKEVTG